MTTWFRRARRCATVLLLVAGFCGAGCGPLWEEHCQGTCPPENVGVFVDDGSVQKSIWVDGSSYGFEVDLWPFCVLSDGVSSTTHVVVRGRGRSLAIEVVDGELARIQSLPGDTVHVVDFDHDGRSEYLALENDYGTSIEATLRLFSEDGDLVWSGESTGDEWQSLDLTGDARLELLVYTPNGLMLVNPRDGSFRRIGNLEYQLAVVAEKGGEKVIVAYAFADEYQTLIQTWGVNGEKLGEDRYGELVLYFDQREGVKDCDQEVYDPNNQTGEYVTSITHTTLVYSSPWGLLGGRLRGMPDNRTIRTRIEIRNAQARIIYGEVLGGGNEGHFAVVHATDSHDSLVLTDGTRLIRYQLPDSP